MGTGSREPLTIHKGADFICKALRVEIIIKSTPMILEYQWTHTSEEQRWKVKIKCHSKGLNTSVYAIIIQYFSSFPFVICKNCKTVLSPSSDSVLFWLISFEAFLVPRLQNLTAFQKKKKKKLVQIYFFHINLYISHIYNRNFWQQVKDVVSKTN